MFYTEIAAVHEEHTPGQNEIEEFGRDRCRVITLLLEESALDLSRAVFDLYEEVVDGRHCFNGNTETAMAN